MAPCYIRYWFLSRHTKACYLQVLIPENPYGFWWTRILVRVPKITLSCGHCDFRLTTENHNDFLVTKIGKNGDVAKQPHSDTKTVDTKTRRKPQRHATATSFLSSWQQSFVAIGIFGQQARQRGVNNEPKVLAPY